MANAAVIIGIDSYKNPKWDLKAAVGDALKFAEWAIAHGNVKPEKLRLLISPKQNNILNFSNIGVPKENITNATRDDMNDIINELQNGWGKGCEYLFFYYAGHGVSPPDSTYFGKDEPVIIPADAQDLRTDEYKLLGFSGLFPKLKSVEPYKQIYFIDACRNFGLQDFVPIAGPAVGPYKNPNADPNQRSCQAVLYATSPGQKANEENKGVFTSVLIEGLNGEGEAKVWSNSEQCYEVDFDSLALYLSSRLEEEIKKWEPINWKKYVQIPQKNYQGQAERIVLSTFEPNQIDKVRVHVRVRPSDARKSCTVEAGIYPFPGNYLRSTSAGPPVQLPCTLELYPMKYSIRAQAKRYEEERKICKAFKSQDIELTLFPTVRGGSKTPFRASGEGKTADGLLSLKTNDPYVQFLIVDSKKKKVQSGFTDGKNPKNIRLSPDIYEVSFILSGQVLDNSTVEVQSNETSNIIMRPTQPKIDPQSLQMLKNIRIRSDNEGYLHPSELLGGIAEARMDSILSYAAFVAILGSRWSSYFYRLKEIGVKPPRGNTGLLILIGDNRTQRSNKFDFLRDIKLTVYKRDKASNTEGIIASSPNIIDYGNLRIFSNFSSAGQRGLDLQPGPYTLMMSLPEFAPTLYELSVLRNRITVFVAVIEDAGEFSIRQYSLPKDTQPGVDDAFLDPNGIRNLEISQRYYTNGEQIPDNFLEDSLNGKVADPIISSIAGYSLTNVGNQARFKEKAMNNMLEYFEDLPDSHILAGLCEPEKKADHFANAIKLGVPMFAEGFRLLYNYWVEEQNEDNKRLSAFFYLPHRGLLTSSIWTAWTLREFPIPLNEELIKLPWKPFFE